MATEVAEGTEFTNGETEKTEAKRRRPVLSAARGLARRPKAGDWAALPRGASPHKASKYAESANVTFSIRRSRFALASRSRETPDSQPGAALAHATGMTPRKLLFHILLHELRHWAQVALAVRLAGFDPPGDHDLFYSHALQ